MSHVALCSAVNGLELLAIVRRRVVDARQVALIGLEFNLLYRFMWVVDYLVYVSARVRLSSVDIRLRSR